MSYNFDQEKEVTKHEGVLVGVRVKIELRRVITGTQDTLLSSRWVAKVKNIQCTRGSFRLHNSNFLTLQS